MYDPLDTIAAIASAPGAAARGIVRLSGPHVRAVIEACFRSRDGTRLDVIHAPTVVSGSVRLVESTVDELPAELYWWPIARSYTRQPAAEIHTVGSPPLVDAVLRTVCAAGARLAQPGEFTLRAFLAGRIDLTQAEAVLAAIDARGERAFATALEQMAGGLARPLDQLRETLLDLLARLEAGLDFVEDDIEFITAAEVQQELHIARQAMEGLEAQLSGRLRHDAPPRAALVGWPNAGKSSLFNALSRHGQALVSNQAGTTRDYLTAELDLEGVRCQLIDTAGVEAGRIEPEEMETVAQSLAAAQAAGCDVRLLCLDGARPLNDWERAALARADAPEQLVVLTKCDLRSPALPRGGAIETSALSGAGLEALRQALRRAVVDVESRDSGFGATQARAAESLRAAAGSLAAAAQLNATAAGDELVAAEVRVALDELGKVTGAVYTDDILERIFSRFCIGK